MGFFTAPLDMENHRHAPGWKVVINTPLRWIQWLFTNEPWLIASVFEDEQLEGYTFCRIEVRGGCWW